MARLDHQFRQNLVDDFSQHVLSGARPGHPDLPGRFILGVECDGATYHSAKATRDCDRLRQTVLERLGWQIHRVRSTDWFRDPHAEFEILLRRIDSLRGIGRSQMAE